MKSHKVQLEAMHRSKQSDFESSSSDFERSVASKEKEACSSSDFERSVASKHTRAILRGLRALEASWRHLGDILERLEGVLKASWSVLDAS